MAVKLKAKKNETFAVKKHKTFKNRVGEEFDEGDAMPDMADKIKTLPRVVGVSMGMTINMGNYESQRIDVWATDEMQTDETREEAIYRVAEELSSTLEKMRKELGR